MTCAVVHVEDMMCVACENTLARVLSAIEGVSVVSADYTAGEVRVVFGPPATPAALCAAVDASGYSCGDVEVEGAGEGDAAGSGRPGLAPELASEPAPVSPSTPEPVQCDRDPRVISDAGVSAPAPGAPAPARTRRDFTAAGILVALLGLYVVADELGILDKLNVFPVVGTDPMGYLALFTTGLLTSVHCVAMCGGINLAQSVAGSKGAPLARAGLYNAGRLVGYTLIGGLLGLLGSAIAITTEVRAAIGVLAGAFMVALGVGMLGRFSFMRALTPKLPAPATRALAALASRGSFCVGLANGLMPCGPLQAMQLYAVASGDFFAGATSMFAFCLGTVPLMFAFSGLAGLLRTAGKRALMQASAVVVMALGVVLVGNSLAVVGVSLPSLSALFAQEGDFVVAELLDDGTQLVTTTLHEDGYESIQVQAGVPVVWVIEASAEALNGCNNVIVVAEYGLEVTLVEGANIIEFTPTEAGTFTFSCWMGMLHATIEVVD